ncbi:MAG: hypothetical protein GTO14_16635 [Anaerolineales bacterium]|nr:hypothetical protein [Anaerolineales bacterium]
MSVQVEAMAPLTSPNARTPLYTGVAVTGSAAIAAGLGFAILYIFNRTIEPSVLVIASAAGLGLVVGLVSRFTLPHRGPLIRWLVALFGLSAGMIFLGWLSKGLLGMDLIGRRVPEPDWEGLLRFASGAVAAWLAVRAWAKRPSAALSPSHPRSRRFSRSNLQRVLRSRVRPGGDVMAPSALAHASATGVPTRRQSVGLGTTQRGRARVRKAPLKADKQKRIGRTKRRSQARIRLTAHVEHRCPYCLEIVEPRDSRGVVECSTCHTSHHADCWAVTGTCQVPHHNS